MRHHRAHSDAIIMAIWCWLKLLMSQFNTNVLAIVFGLSILSLIAMSYVKNGHLGINSSGHFGPVRRHDCRPWLVLAPVPLSIFRSNSKFDENSERSSFEYTRPITTIFCTRHDSDTVVTCAKYRCDRPRIFYARVFWIFIEFRIRSKYA